MPPSGEKKRRYTRRCNSNGEDVAPSVCACYYKAPQRQADNSGGYILDFFRSEKRKNLHPLDTRGEMMVEYPVSTRTIDKENQNGS